MKRSSTARTYLGCLLGLLLVSGTPAVATGPNLDQVVEQAQRTERLHSLLVLHQGMPVIEHVQAGPGLGQPANIKSVSKTVLAALAGIAIDRGLVSGIDQPLIELLGSRVPTDLDPRINSITFGHALSMQTGLESTSGSNYGRWVLSGDWVAHALTRPFVDDPGGRMIYSTGSTHLVAAALTEVSGRSLAELANEWLGGPLEVAIPTWMTDPQGIHFGGNEMLLSPRALARFGELYREGGQRNGRVVIPQWWIGASWRPRGHSRWTGDAYGYGWFMTEIAGQRAYYGRGYGGQALFVLPDAGLTVVVTSDPHPPSSGSRFGQIRELVALIVHTLDDEAR